MPKPLALSMNLFYSGRLLLANGYRIIGTHGYLHKIQGFDSYNHLLSLNSIFSSEPKFDPVDRTGKAVGAVRFAAPRPWQVPQQQIDLHTAMQRRVQEISARNEPINIMWSGGIDSTAILVAFLRYAPDLKKCRVIYSPWSTYEHPEFFKLLQKFDTLEKVDISGELYLTQNLDGVYVSGNTGDEMHASLDKSFFDQVGFQGLQQNYKDFFAAQGAHHELIDFCSDHFAAAGRPIESVLEARWWFYQSCKLTSILYLSDFSLLYSGPTSFSADRLIGFFDSVCYEQFIYFNIDRIIESDNYAVWKQFLKDFCYEFDGFDNWRRTKIKFSSAQTRIYGLKKQAINNQRALLWLEDGSAVSLKNLPFFSAKEWRMIEPQYQYLFRSATGVHTSE